MIDRMASTTVAVAANALTLTSCGGLAERSFETESGSWVLFTQPALLLEGRTAVAVFDSSAGKIKIGEE